MVFPRNIISSLNHVERTIDIIRLAFRLTFNVGIHKNRISISNAEPGIPDIEGGCTHTFYTARKDDIRVSAHNLHHTA